MELGPLLLSFEIAVVATALAALFGIGIAALLANVRFPGRDVLDVVSTAPMVMPPTVLGYYVLTLLGRQSFIGHAFERLTGSSIVFTKTGAVIAALIGGLPLVVRHARTAFEEVDPLLLSAAKTLGATPLRAFYTVQLPLAARGVIASLMLAFARALGDFGVTLMVAGNIPGETRTASLAIYDALQSQRERDAGINVAVLTILAVSVLYVVGKLTRKAKR